MLEAFINTMVDLIEATSQVVAPTPDEETSSRWFVLKAFLWTSWQRCQIIEFHTLAGYQALMGFANQDGHSLNLRETFPSSGVLIQETSKKRADLNTPAYMYS